LTVRSRQKHLKAKRLASSSPAALAEILGVPISSLPSSVTGSPGPSIPPLTSLKEDCKVGILESTDGRSAEEVISTSAVSVADYFKEKLRAKALARQGGAALSEGSLALVKDEVKVVVGGAGWEGSKVVFGENSEVKLEFVEEGLKMEEVVKLEEAASGIKEERKETKEERKERREAKKALKLATGKTSKKRKAADSEASVPKKVKAERVKEQ
jgi:Pin2-interacting protein X1